MRLATTDRRGLEPVVLAALVVTTVTLGAGTATADPSPESVTAFLLGADLVVEFTETGLKPNEDVGYELYTDVVAAFDCHAPSGAVVRGAIVEAPEAGTTATFNSGPDGTVSAYLKLEVEDALAGYWVDLCPSGARQPVMREIGYTAIMLDDVTYGVPLTPEPRDLWGEISTD